MQATKIRWEPSTSTRFTTNTIKQNLPVEKIKQNIEEKSHKQKKQTDVPMLPDVRHRPQSTELQILLSLINQAVFILEKKTADRLLFRMADAYQLN